MGLLIVAISYTKVFDVDTYVKYQLYILNDNKMRLSYLDATLFTYPNWLVRRIGQIMTLWNIELNCLLKVNSVSWDVHKKF